MDQRPPLAIRNAIGIPFVIWLLATPATAQQDDGSWRQQQERENFYGSQQRQSEDESFWRQHDIEQGVQRDEGFYFPPGVTTNPLSPSPDGGEPPP